jgi:hypothetical protein
MTSPNSKRKTSKPITVTKKPLKAAAKSKSDTETLLNRLPLDELKIIDIYLNHQRAIDTLNSFLKITPSDDDYHPLLALIADQLNRTFLDVIPVFASSSANSRGPATRTSSKHGLSRVPN